MLVPTLSTIGFGAGFNRVRKGLELLDDPSVLADRLVEYLAWMAVASEVNGEREDDGKAGAWVDHLYRAYPDLSGDILGDSQVTTVGEAAVAMAPQLGNLVSQVGFDRVNRTVRESESTASFVGHVNERVLGHPLRCCVYSPNTTLQNGYLASVTPDMKEGPVVRGDLWQSVVKLDGRIYKEINQLHKRPGGAIHCVQWVAFEYATSKLHVSRVHVQEPAPNCYHVLGVDRYSPKEITGLNKNLGLQINEAYALQLRRRYDWEVEFSLTSSRTGIVVTTDAESAKEMLATRTKAPRGRRAALVHWVREHWRKGRTTAPSNVLDPVFVRSHLRGKIECEYGGMHCRIYPSQYDLDRACNGPRIQARLESR